MSDLGAFLMARLDHEEAQVRALAAADGVDEELLDSAHRLADIDAKRRIINEIVPEINDLDAQVDIAFSLPGEKHDPPGEKLLRLLALPYADHPAYDESWRP